MAWVQRELKVAFQQNLRITIISKKEAKFLVAIILPLSRFD